MQNIYYNKGIAFIHIYTNEILLTKQHYHDYIELYEPQ